MSLSPAFQVVENLELNRDSSGTGKSARKIARRIRDTVKGMGLVGIVKDMKPSTPCIVPVPLSKEISDLIKGYQVSFECLENSSEVQQRVQMPAFEPVQGDSGPQFSITCPTPGAVIWYTTDDSFPWRENPTAKQYVAPINVPASGVMIVRAAAYFSGFFGSWVNRVTIDIEFQ